MLLPSYTLLIFLLADRLPNAYLQKALHPIPCVNTMLAGTLDGCNLSNATQESRAINAFYDAMIQINHPDQDWWLNIRRNSLGAGYQHPVSHKTELGLYAYYDYLHQLRSEPIGFPQFRKSKLYEYSRHTLNLGFEQHSTVVYNLLQQKHTKIMCNFYKHFNFYDTKAIYGVLCSDWQIDFSCTVDKGRWSFTQGMSIDNMMLTGAYSRRFIPKYFINNTYFYGVKYRYNDCHVGFKVLLRSEPLNYLDIDFIVEKIKVFGKVYHPAPRYLHLKPFSNDNYTSVNELITSTDRSKIALYINESINHLKDLSDRSHPSCKITFSQNEHSCVELFQQFRPYFERMGQKNFHPKYTPSTSAIGHRSRLYRMWEYRFTTHAITFFNTLLKHGIQNRHLNDHTFQMLIDYEQPENRAIIDTEAPFIKRLREAIRDFLRVEKIYYFDEQFRVFPSDLSPTQTQFYFASPDEFHNEYRRYLNHLMGIVKEPKFGLLCSPSRKNIPNNAYGYNDYKQFVIDHDITLLSDPRIMRMQSIHQKIRKGMALKSMNYCSMLFLSGTDFPTRIRLSCFNSIPFTYGQHTHQMRYIDSRQQMIHRLKRLPCELRELIFKQVIEEAITDSLKDVVLNNTDNGQSVIPGDMAEIWRQLRYDIPTVERFHNYCTQSLYNYLVNIRAKDQLKEYWEIPYYYAKADDIEKMMSKFFFEI